MQRREVHKFGGTSVADAARIRAAATLLAAAWRGGTVGVVAVSSALSGVTDHLLAACSRARAGDMDTVEADVSALRSKHLAVLEGLAPAASTAAMSADGHDLRAEMNHLMDEVTELLHGTALIRELTARARDRVVATGEKLAVRLLAFALRSLGVPAEAMDADGFLATSAAFGEAEPLSYTDCPGVAAALGPRLERGVVPVVTGFVGRAPDGATTTLGRGGSDFTATLLAAALRADETVIWTDVPGVFSADPRVVPGARLLERLSYREAAEMSYYGAKVLHPRTMIPIAKLGIPVRTKSSYEPQKPGTLVEASAEPGPHAVKAVTAVRRQALIDVQGNGMVGVPGVAGRVFTALADAAISVTMISQSSSEASVCLALPEEQADRAHAVLNRAFRDYLADGLIEHVAARAGVALVAAVGAGMAHTPGAAARVCGSLARAGVNILAMAQGSSELNITLAVLGTDADAAVRAIHAEFYGD